MASSNFIMWAGALGKLTIHNDDHLLTPMRSAQIVWFHTKSYCVRKSFLKNELESSVNVSLINGSQREYLATFNMNSLLETQKRPMSNIM